MRPADEILADAVAYVADVRASRIVAGRLTILACDRHARDVEHGAARGLRFNAARAKRALWWIENRLRFSKGEWAGKPFRLAPWQAFIVASLFGWEKLADGRYLRRFRSGYVSVARKQGKALALDTPIPTPDGWSAMGDLRVGDLVFDERGSIARVMEATDAMHGHACYRVEFSDGTSIVADAEHRWVVSARSCNGKRVVLTTRQMAESGVKLPWSRRSHNERNYSMPVTRPIDPGQGGELPLRPYTLGAWLGDGSSHDARLTAGRGGAEILLRIEADGYPVKMVPSSSADPAPVYWIGRKGNGGSCVVAILRALGLLGKGKKHIPAAYLRASEKDRRALLSGLMDTDGHVTKAGQCEISSKYPRLAEDVAELVRSLGMKASISEDRAKISGRDCGPRYRVRFYARAGGECVSLPYKVARLKPAGAPTRNSTIYVTAVTPVESVPVRCIAVDSESHLYLAGRGFTPTHNTELMAAIGLVFLMVPGEAEPGGEVYAAATTRDQAAICWRAAASMVRKSPALRREVGVFDSRHNLAHRESESAFRTVASDSDTLDGLNPLCGIVDEYHAHPDSSVYDVIESGMGARREPLMLVPTTAGGKRAGACWDLETDAVKILEGIGEAEGAGDDLFAFIARLDDGDDWSNEAVWPKANPNLGVSSFIDKLRVGARVAKRRPSALPEFLRKHMNLWTEADHSWLPMPAWDGCGTSADGSADPILAGLSRLRDEDHLVGRRCVIGLDLSAVADYTAAVAVFAPVAGAEDQRFVALSKFWIPAETLIERSHNDRVPVLQWVEQGLVEATAGPVVDQDAIKNWLVSMRDRYEVAEIAMDPHNATKLQSELMALGFTVVSMRQGWVTMSPAIKATERLILTRRLRHGGNPVLRWMASNVHMARDPNDNLTLNKARSGDRIDGIVSLCMAVARAEVLAAPAPAQSYKVRALA